ncbi:unnamed protein product, partial [Rotaria magnacalcarata]
ISMNVELLIAASASNLSRSSELMILPGRSNMYGGLNRPTVTILPNQAAVPVPFQFSTAIRPADNPERMLNIPAEVVTLPPENGPFQGLPPE